MSVDDSRALDLLQDSLVRRMRTMFSLYYDAVDTMSLDQVNHVDQPGRLPIAFSLFHYVNIHDGSFMLITGEPPIWNGGWEARVQPEISAHGEELSRPTLIDYAFISFNTNATFGPTSETVVSRRVKLVMMFQTSLSLLVLLVLVARLVGAATN
ncbi:MAG: hypothetical protein RLZ14_313 [Actinomycetota bacterium]|jgi:hypothetical protein